MVTSRTQAVLEPLTEARLDLLPAKTVMVIIPTYNEQENMPRMIETLFGLNIPNLHLTIVDDNSPDGTADLVEEIGRNQYPGCISVLRRPAKMGLGTAYIKGFRYGLERGATYFVQMDADFSHDPVVLKTFLDNIQEYDMVVGSRYVKGGSLDKRWKMLRRVVSRFGSMYSRAVLGINQRDCTSGFRMYKRHVLEKLPLDSIRTNGYGFQVELSYLVYKLGFSITEVPIHFSERVAGTSKMSAGIAIEAALKVWQVKYKY
jgi:dolichol-phosphate mannosyltransferase